MDLIFGIQVFHFKKMTHHVKLTTVVSTNFEIFISNSKSVGNSLIDF